MSSRADRRRKERGGTAPPRRRDPMIGVYIALGVVLVLVFAGFGIWSWIANSRTSSYMAFVLSTPTPGPKAISKPIQLQDGKGLGKRVFPTPNPRGGFFADTPQGGQNQPVDGIPCQAAEQAVLHVHTHLAILNHGVLIQVPPYVGFAGNSSLPQGGCLYWIHTHDGSGIIHLEAGSAISPNGGNYTIGNFFDVWGQPLSRTRIGPFTGNVTAYLNGYPYNGDLATIPLRAHQQVVLEIGQPVVPPPYYAFPLND